MRAHRPLILSLAAGLALLGGGAATAGALRVSPVALDLPVGQATAALTLHNDDDTPMNIQVRVYRWTQQGGEDHLDPTDDVVVSPPIGSIAPHGERIVRVVRTAAPTATEQDYRLVVDELPPPPDSDAPQVRLLMRHSIPLFFSSAPGKAKVVWSSQVASDGVTLTGANPGGRRLRLSNLKLLDADGAPVADRAGLVGYVLAGAQISWKLPVGAQPSKRPAARLVAETDAGPIDVSLAAAP